MPSVQLIGMVHCGPLPGAPRYRPPCEAVVRAAVEDAVALERAGFDAVLVENYGDAPYFPDDVPAATVAAMARVVAAVRAAVDMPIGVNVLRNDAIAALSIAAACDAQFIRVNVLSGVMYTDQGLVQGRAADVARLRATIAPVVEVLADVFVKHAAPPPGVGIAEAAADLLDRAMADGVIVSGPATGLPADTEAIRRVHAAAPGARILAGSGVSSANAPALARLVDGMIVGTYVKQEGDVHRPVDPDRAATLVQAARSG